MIETDAHNKTWHGAFRVVLAYAVFAAAWIFLSDRAIGLLFSDPEALVQASMAKGWLFVAVTSLLLYVLVHRLVSQIDTAHRHELEMERESERRLHTLIDHAPVALAMFDREMRYLALSRRWRTDFEIGDRDVLGCSHYEIFPDLRAEWKAAHQRGLAGAVVASAGDAFKRSDGQTIWTRWEVQPWRAVDGSIGGIVIFAEDITERRQAENALRASEDRFHGIVDASADWIWEVDAEGRYTYASENVMELLGYIPAEMIGKTPFDFMPPDEAVRVRGEFLAVVAQKRPFRDLDNINVHKDGSLRHVWTNGMPILDDDGRLIGYRGLDRDISERKRNEEALRESEERYRSLVVNLKEVIFQTDARGLWTFLNPAWEEVTGFPVAASLGTLFLDYVHPDDRQRNQELFEPLIRREKDYCRHTIRYLHKAGGFRWIEVYARLTLDAQGNIVGTSGTLLDITEKKQADEEQQVRNQDLMRFNRAMVDREFDMIEMKKTINALHRELGREPPYSLAFLDDEEGRGSS